MAAEPPPSNFVSRRMPLGNLVRADAARLDEFVALNDELAGLARAGLPLELGLSGGDRRRLADRIGDRLRAGSSLGDALRQEGEGVPAAYRALVEAGMRSGRLAEAVETVSRTARALISVRRRLSLATIYPAAIVLAAWGLAVAILPRLLGPVIEISTDLGQPPPRLAAALLSILTDNRGYWQFWAPPAAIALLWMAGGLSAVTRRLPGLGPAVAAYRLSVFAELAAGLLEHGQPLEESLRLAGEASGDRRLARGGRDVADRIRAGEPAGQALAGLTSPPAFARWMISTGAATGTLPGTLRQIADWSARRAAARADWFALVAPLAVTLLVGGAATAAFAAASLAPVIQLLDRLLRDTF